MGVVIRLKREAGQVGTQVLIHPKKLRALLEAHEGLACFQEHEVRQPRARTYQNACDKYNLVTKGMRLNLRCGS